ncbi:UDP-MurNAc-pentapeptide synthetase [Syntrophomonas zehnderi OL-4]|uniref:UDP-N-acetylmuramoyl-tripeptide--D-alanyl-D-alanine ligase n=1 Tax=Syntrophomonas zehnderi OL-4 TaxID=690567 RepID=A0A0E4C8P1_9FIRM|nr:UDP-N-acetylmuramoyl-tripeptide--D-alanyl-D-alanine ligase [Syntrophomonas zehnderi]CFX62681.1 UDP-MurNAc-pentapeptide synthetase [Syntrophomonas zehnderi OL-4]
MKLGLDFIIAGTGGQLLSGSEEVVITGVSTDSRTIMPGELFVALTGERFDGHDFIPDLVNKGVTAVLIDRPDCISSVAPDTAVILVKDTLEALQKLAAVYRQTFALPVVAVTGSVGKTTTKDMLAACMAQSFNVLKTWGNYNNEIGLPLTLLKLNEKHQAAVIEIGMRNTGEIRHLSSLLQPAYAIITNVEAVHLETMGTLLNIARAKCEVLEFISEDGFALLNGDNQLLLTTASDFPCRIYTFGYQPHNDIQILSVENDGSQIKVDLKLFACRESFRLPLPVNQLAGNLAAAAGMAFLMGIDRKEIKAALAGFKTGDKRMNLIPLSSGGVAVDDTYNANPQSMMAALDACREMKQERRFVAVLGDMLELGDLEKEGHMQVGGHAAQMNLDLLITIGDRARYYREGAIKQGMLAGKIHHFNHQKEALKWLTENIGPADLVLFKASRGQQFDILLADWMRELSTS